MGLMRLALWEKKVFEDGESFAKMIFWKQVFGGGFKKNMVELIKIFRLWPLDSFEHFFFFLRGPIEYCKKGFQNRYPTYMQANDAPLVGIMNLIKCTLKTLETMKKYNLGMWGAPPSMPVMSSWWWPAKPAGWRVRIPIHHTLPETNSSPPWKMRFLLETSICRGELLAFGGVHPNDKSTTPSQYWLDDHLCTWILGLRMPTPFPVTVTFSLIITFFCRGIPISLSNLFLHCAVEHPKIYPHKSVEIRRYLRCKSLWYPKLHPVLMVRSQMSLPPPPLRRLENNRRWIPSKV